MLSALTVQNYRSFVEPTQLLLRPLTLVFGQNNSGKSALLRLLPLLADSASDRSRGPLDLSSPSIRGASFAGLHSRPPLSSRPEIDLGLEWANGNAGDLTYRLTVRSFPELRRNLIRSFDVTGAGSTFHAELIPRFDLADEQLPYQVQSEGQQRDLSIRFSGLIPCVVAEDPPSPLSAALAALHNALGRLAEEVQWLGSVRSLPEREVAFWGEPPSRISPEGSGTVEALVADQFRERKLFPAVSGWFERVLGLRLDVEARSERFAVVLSPLSEPTLRVNLLDTGEGITQVLPIVVAIERARQQSSPRRLLALEQPELHLHPAAQKALGDYICEVAADDVPPTMVIETHSENVLLSVQLAVLEAKIPSENVAIYWVSNDARGRSSVELLPFDDSARPRGWPPDAFRERLEQSRDLVSARLRSSSG